MTPHVCERCMATQALSSTGVVLSIKNISRLESIRRDSLNPLILRSLFTAVFLPLRPTKSFSTKYHVPLDFILILDFQGTELVCNTLCAFLWMGYFFSSFIMEPNGSKWSQIITCEWKLYMQNLPTKCQDILSVCQCIDNVVDSF